MSWYRWQVHFIGKNMKSQEPGLWMAFPCKFKNLSWILLLFIKKYAYSHFYELLYSLLKKIDALTIINTRVRIASKLWETQEAKGELSLEKHKPRSLLGLYYKKYKLGSMMCTLVFLSILYLCNSQRVTRPRASSTNDSTNLEKLKVVQVKHKCTIIRKVKSKSR
jgi:hypothetical protein